MVKNRKCVCCSKTYSYCPDCSKADKLAPSWKATFCSEDCMKLWTTATKYNMGRLTKSEAKEIISALTLKPTSEYVPCVQRDLGVIMKEDPKPKRSKRVAAQPVDEPTLIDQIHEVVIQENE